MWNEVTYGRDTCRIQVTFKSHMNVTSSHIWLWATSHSSHVWMWHDSVMCLPHMCDVLHMRNVCNVSFHIWMWVTSHSSHIWMWLQVTYECESRQIQVTSECGITPSRVSHMKNVCNVSVTHLNTSKHTNDPRHDSFDVWRTSHMCVMLSHIRAWLDSFMCVCHDSFTCATWHIHMWRDSFMCVPWFIYMCDLTHSYVWLDSFICVMWLIHSCGMSPSHICHTHTYGVHICPPSTSTLPKTFTVTDIYVGICMYM